MKTVIIYTTKRGSVRKAAEMLKPKLEGEVRLVDMKREKAPPLDEYDCVILGGSIYYFRIKGKLKKYALENLPALLKKKVGLFICAGAAPDSDVCRKQFSSAFPQELYEHAVCKDIFGYEYAYEKMNFFEKMVFSKMNNGAKTGKSVFYEDRISSFAEAVNGQDAAPN